MRLSVQLGTNLFYRFQANIFFHIIYAVFGCVFMTGAKHLYYKLDQYWHNYKGDEFCCSFVLSFSLSVSPPIFIIRFLGGLILYTLARSKIPFFRFKSFAFFALKLNFLLCILSVTFLLSLWTYNELLVTFGNVSSMLFLFFKEKHNHFLSEANQYFIAWTFLCIECIFGWLSDNGNSISIVYFFQ